MATVTEVLLIGLDHFKSGRLAQAEAVYRRVLDFDPGQTDALHLLGLVFHQRGETSAAIDLIGRAIAIVGDNQSYHLNLGNALRAAGRIGEATASYRRALTLAPDTAEAWNNLGLVHSEQGDFAAAAEHFRQATAVAPDYAPAWGNLGVVRDRAGDPGGAAHCYRRALALKLDFVDAHDHLGQVLVQLDRGAEAEACHRRALALAPDRAVARSGLATAMARQGRAHEAIAEYLSAIALDPAYAPAATNLGSILHEHRRLDEAISYHRRAIALSPALATAYGNLTAALSASGAIDLALRTCRHVFEFVPGDALAHNNLAIALQDMGELDEAIASFRQALANNSDFTAAHSNLLFALLYDPRVDGASLMAEHRRWGERHARMAAPRRRSDARPLRVGYVSPDFFRHSASYFSLPLIESHDAKAVEVFGYAEVKEPDEVTRQFQRHATGWRSTVGRGDDEVADLIRSDGIDVLVDLAGHTAGNRLGVFARRAAPVQVTWLGYPCSTGLTTIDYLIGDAVLTPPDVPALEPIWRLDRPWVCYRAPDYAPVPSPLPARSAGHVTFGSFGNLAKLNKGVVVAWSEILAQVPDARLVLNTRCLADAATRARVLRLFACHGIGPERLTLIATTPHAVTLAQYAAIDIALDPFPFNGLTVTCEALWLGVPVVTLAMQDRPVGRMGAALNAGLGLQSLTAATPAAYVEAAVALARNLDHLAELREGLPRRMATSPLADSQGLARSLERAFRTMWEAHGQPH